MDLYITVQVIKKKSFKTCYINFCRKNPKLKLKMKREHIKINDL
jgi:hypothetical protein